VLVDEVPADGESFFVAECFRRLKRLGLAGVVSFSDPVPRSTLDGRVIKPGHCGTVYQALSARFLGRSPPRTLRLLPDGTALSDRTVQKLRSGEPGTQTRRSTLAALGAELPQEPDPEVLRRVLDRYTRPHRHAGNFKYGWVFHAPRIAIYRHRGPIQSSHRYPIAPGNIEITVLGAPPARPGRPADMRRPTA